MTQIASRKLTLLVVDDEPAIPRMLVDALKEPGLTVLTATQADKAVEIFRQNRGIIDLVLLDLQMYPRNGLELLSELQQIDPHVRVAFMSGSPSEGQMAKLLEEGSATVFTKPFVSLADLSSALKRDDAEGIGIIHFRKVFFSSLTYSFLFSDKNRSNQVPARLFAR